MFRICMQVANAEKIEKPDRTLVALEGIARSIRDDSGSAKSADEYISSLACSIPTSDDTPSNRVRLAAAKVKPSAILSFESGRPGLCLEDPSAKATADPKLAIWLAQWQSSKFEQKYADDLNDELLQLLKTTHLSSLTLVSIGRSISFRCADERIIAAFFAAAALRAHKEFVQTINPTDARQMLVGLILAKPILWRVVDGGNRTFVDALYVLNCDLAYRIPVNDHELENARIHGFIGAAECLWLNGKNDDALKTLHLIDGCDLTAEQTRAAAWIRGLVFVSMNRYADAGREFQIVTQAPEYAYTESASRWLAVCLARSGKVADGNIAFDNWVRRYRPDVKLAGRVLGLMQAGTL